MNPIAWWRLRPFINFHWCCEKWPERWVLYLGWLLLCLLCYGSQFEIFISFYIMFHFKPIIDLTGDIWQMEFESDVEAFAYLSKVSTEAAGQVLHLINNRVVCLTDRNCEFEVKLSHRNQNGRKVVYLKQKGAIQFHSCHGSSTPPGRFISTTLISKYLCNNALCAIIR